jgi:hypothetical protein
VDVPRTFPQEELGKELSFQTSLKNILVAYANADEEIGYVQGMNFLAGMFLFYQAEEAAFWSFYALMSRGNNPHRRVFLRDLPELIVLAQVTDKLIEQRFPNIWTAFKEHDISSIILLAQWFNSCFVNGDFELEMNTFIYDQFLAYGSPPLLSFGLTILSLSSHILEKDGFAAFLDHASHPGKSDIFHVRQRVNVEWGRQWITSSEFHAWAAEFGGVPKSPRMKRDASLSPKSKPEELEDPEKK